MFLLKSLDSKGLKITEDKPKDKNPKSDILKKSFERVFI